MRRFFKKKLSVAANHFGLLFKQNMLYKVLEPGVYQFYDWKDELVLRQVSKIPKILTITNQEVLTKDNISLRFSYAVEYKIVDVETYAKTTNVFSVLSSARKDVEELIWNYSQYHLREQIARVDSQELNAQRDKILTQVPDGLKNKLIEYGVTIQNLLLKDISFPKFIQSLFAKQLEAKMKGKADLENARTAVATARAFKNAAELMKDNEEVKFFKFLDTIGKIAQRGNHTFMIGNMEKGNFK